MLFLAGSPATNWLNTTFLPHVVAETRSVLLNSLKDLGITLFLSGAVVFIGCAGQIYWAKLFNKAMVSSGLYRYVRHPQYGALMICGLGMLLLWPRYLVLVSYITMLFVYVWLGRLEERECLRKYGTGYLFYYASTPMFFPFAPTPGLRPARQPLPVPVKITLTLIVYLGVVGTAVFWSGQLRNWSIGQLFTVFSKETVILSVVAFEEHKMLSIMNLVQSDARVRHYFAAGSATDRYINYLTPLDWSASEIPMRQREDGEHLTHRIRPNLELFKIIFTRAELTNREATGKEILALTVQRTPVAEVVIDVFNMKIIEVLGPTQQYPLRSVPLPLF